MSMVPQVADAHGPFDFIAPFPWSLLKLEILEKYSNALAAIVGSRFPICFVDLMAGEGYYASGDLGSAGRLAALAQAHRDDGRSVKVIAIEENAEAFRALESNTAAVRAFVGVRNARWQDQVQPLLDELQGSFVLFFVDPMGIEEIPWNDLSPLITRQNTELLINFNSSIAARLAGLVMSGRNSPVLAGCFDGDSWTTGIDEARATQGTHQHMASAYMNLLHGRGNYAVSSSPIAEFGDRGRHKYHMIFASRNIKAFAVMNDILAIQHENLERSRAAAGALPLFPFNPDEYEREKEDRINRELADSLARDVTLRGWSGTIQDLRIRAFRSRFATYKFMYYAGAVTLLVDQQRIGLLSADKRRRSKGQLTPKLLLDARVQF